MLQFLANSGEFSKLTLLLQWSISSDSIVSKSEPQFPWNIMQSLSAARLRLHIRSSWSQLWWAESENIWKPVIWRAPSRDLCAKAFHKRQYWQCCNIFATNIFSCFTPKYTFLPAQFLWLLEKQGLLFDYKGVNWS